MPSFVALAATMMLFAAPAEADVLFTYSGAVQGLTVHGAPAGTLPFPTGTPLHASFLVPGITAATGAWSTLSSNFFIGSDATPGTYIPGSAWFGDTPGLRSLRLAGVDTYLAGIGANLGKADFCCEWSSDVLPVTSENGQVVFQAGDFWALYMPEGGSGLGYNWARATGSGVWTATQLPDGGPQPVPEPLGVGLLAGALLALGAVRLRVAA